LRTCQFKCISCLDIAVGSRCSDDERFWLGHPDRLSEGSNVARSVDVSLRRLNGSLSAKTCAVDPTQSAVVSKFFFEH
jgi:hypothetical protein